MLPAFCRSLFSGSWLTEAGSRKLIAYTRIPDAEVDEDEVRAWMARSVDKGEGTTANELNPFRKMYFTSTKVES